MSNDENLASDATCIYEDEQRRDYQIHAWVKQGAIFSWNLKHFGVMGIIRRFLLKDL
jgi:hypothetical protein